MNNKFNVCILGLKASYRKQICELYPEYIERVKKNYIRFTPDVMIFTDQNHEVLELMFFNPHLFEQTQKYFIPYKDFAYLEVI